MTHKAIEFLGGPWDGEARELPLGSTEWRVVARVAPAKVTLDDHGEPQSPYHLYRIHGGEAWYAGLIVPRRKPRRRNA